MNLDDFVTTNTGKAVTYDGLQENYGQCEQLVCLYWEQVLGFKCPLIPEAKDLWTNETVLANFDQIPVGQEQKGDVAVWGASSLINSPEFGHTDIVLVPGFIGFDSNWGGIKTPDGYPAAHKVQHVYTDVLGFLRKKGGEMSDPINANDFVNIGNFLGFKFPQNYIDAWVGNTDWKALQYDIMKQPEIIAILKGNAVVLAPGNYKVN